MTETAATVTLVYVGLHEDVFLPALANRAVEHGDTIEVPAELAGRKPDGDDPGEGLLAQADNWTTPSTKRAKQAAELLKVRRAAAPSDAVVPQDAPVAPLAVPTVVV